MDWTEATDLRDALRVKLGKRHGRVGGFSACEGSSFGGLEVGDEITHVTWQVRGWVWKVGEAWWFQKKANGSQDFEEPTDRTNLIHPFKLVFTSEIGLMKPYASAKPIAKN